MSGGKQKIVLVLLGLSIGAVISAGLLFVGYKSRLLHFPATLQDLGVLKRGLESSKTSAYIYDEDLGYRLKPNFTGPRVGTKPHRTNSLGLLGERELDPDPSVRKILFLGDSVTFGDGVPFENAFVSRMQSMAGPGIQLLNAGCVGWSTYQELLYYDKYLKDKDISMVVVCFVLNDLIKVPFVFEPSKQKHVPTGELLEAMKLMGRNARLGLIQKRFALRRETAPLARHDTDFLTAWDDSYWKSYVIDILGPLPSDRDRLPVVFLAIPTSFQIESALRKAPADLVFLPQKRLRDFCRERRIPCFDAAPAFLAASANRPLFWDQCHLTQEGNEEVASFLWPRLLELLQKQPPPTDG